MNIDVVIPYRFSPITRDAELRYALRGIEKHLTGVQQVWVIGDKPNYLNTDIGHIQCLETNWYQQLTTNIYRKLIIACSDSRISDPFLYMNDDHFLLTDYSAVDIPFYHNSKCWTGSGKYKVTIANTLARYPQANNFDTHAPMLIHKDLFLKAMAVLPWKNDFGFAIKTAYCAYHGIKGVYYPDYKLDRKPLTDAFIHIQTRKFFSVGDKAMTKEMLTFLNFLYPVKSKYEI